MYGGKKNPAVHGDVPLRGAQPPVAGYPLGAVDVLPQPKGSLVVGVSVEGRVADAS